MEFMLFYEIYLIIKSQVFKSYKVCTGCLPVDRCGRPTCTSVHASLSWWAGRPGQSTVQRVLLSGNGPGRPAESCYSLYPVSVDRWHNGHKMTVGPVDRAVNRKGKSALSSCQRADSFGAINTPHLN